MRRRGALPLEELFGDLDATFAQIDERPHERKTEIVLALLARHARRRADEDALSMSALVVHDLGRGLLDAGNLHDGDVARVARKLGVHIVGLGAKKRCRDRQVFRHENDGCERGRPASFR